MEFVIERTAEEQVNVMHSIMRECVAALSRKEFFVDDTPEVIAERLQNGGFGCIARHGDEIAGFLLVDLPGEAARNLGNDLGWPKEERLKSAHVDTVCVRPAFRGHGLQKRLVAEGEKEMRRRGVVHSLATVHPDNVASLSSMLALDYQIVATKEKYGGLLRHVLVKRVAEEAGGKAFC